MVANNIQNINKFALEILQFYYNVYHKHYYNII